MLFAFHPCRQPSAFWISFYVYLSSGENSHILDGRKKLTKGEGLIYIWFTKRRIIPEAARNTHEAPPMGYGYGKGSLESV
jgi:hypothetical protein